VGTYSQRGLWMGRRSSRRHEVYLSRARAITGRAMT
jgi:hypothetical protein